MARARLKALKYPKDLIEEVAELVFLHLRFYGYRTGEWTDSAVRRYVVDAGPLLPRLHKLVRSDSTTRNQRKAAALSAAYDALEERIAELAEQEELDAIRPDLDGNQIMAHPRAAARAGRRCGLPATCWSCAWIRVRSAPSGPRPSSGPGTRRAPRPAERATTASQ